MASSPSRLSIMYTNAKPAKHDKFSPCPQAEALSLVMTHDHLWQPLPHCNSR